MAPPKSPIYNPDEDPLLQSILQYAEAEKAGASLMEATPDEITERIRVADGLVEYSKFLGKKGQFIGLRQAQLRDEEIGSQPAGALTLEYQGDVEKRSLAEAEKEFAERFETPFTTAWGGYAEKVVRGLTPSAGRPINVTPEKEKPASIFDAIAPTTIALPASKRIEKPSIKWEKVREVLAEGSTPEKADLNLKAIQEAFFASQDRNPNEPAQKVYDQVVEEILAISEAPTFKPHEQKTKDPTIRAFSRQESSKNIPKYTRTQQEFLSTLNDIQRKKSQKNAERGLKGTPIDIVIVKGRRYPKSVVDMIKSGSKADHEARPDFYSKEEDDRIRKENTSSVARDNLDLSRDIDAVALSVALGEFPAEWWLNTELTKKVVGNLDDFTKGIFEAESPIGKTETTGGWLIRSAMTVPNLAAGLLIDATTGPELAGIKEQYRRDTGQELYAEHGVLANIALNKGLPGETEEASAALNLSPTASRFLMAGSVAADLFLDPSIELTGGLAKGLRVASKRGTASKAATGLYQPVKAFKEGGKAGLQFIQKEYLPTALLSKRIGNISVGDVRLSVAEDVAANYRTINVIQETLAQTTDLTTIQRALTDAGLDKTIAAKSFGDAAKTSSTTDALQTVITKGGDELTEYMADAVSYTGAPTARVVDDITKHFDYKNNADGLSREDFTNQVIQEQPELAKQTVARNRALEQVFIKTKGLDTLDDYIFITKNNIVPKADADGIMKSVSKELETLGLSDLSKQPTRREVIQSEASLVGKSAPSEEAVYDLSKASPELAQAVKQSFGDGSVTVKNHRKLIDSIVDKQIATQKSNAIPTELTRHLDPEEETRLLDPTRTLFSARDIGKALKPLERIPGDIRTLGRTLGGELAKVDAKLGGFGKRTVEIGANITGITPSKAKIGKIASFPKKPIIKDTGLPFSASQRVLVEKTKGQMEGLNTRLIETVRGLAKNDPELNAIYGLGPNQLIRSREEALSVAIHGLKAKGKGGLDAVQEATRAEGIQDALKWTAETSTFAEGSVPSLLAKRSKKVQKRVFNEAATAELDALAKAASKRVMEDPRIFFDEAQVLAEQAIILASNKKNLAIGVTPQDIRHTKGTILEEVMNGAFYRVEGNRILDQSMSEIYADDLALYASQRNFDQISEGAGSNLSAHLKAAEQSGVTSMGDLLQETIKGKLNGEKANDSIIKTLKSRLDNTDYPMAKLSDDYANLINHNGIHTEDTKYLNELLSQLEKGADNVIRKNDIGKWAGADPQEIAKGIDDLFQSDEIAAMLGKEAYEELVAEIGKGRLDNMGTEIYNTLQRLEKGPLSLEAIRKYWQNLNSLRYTLMLNVRPAFHAGNILTGNFINYMTTGSLLLNPVSPRIWKTMIKGANKADGGRHAIAITDKAGRSYTHAEVYEAIMQGGIESPSSFITSLNSADAISFMKRAGIKNAKNLAKKIPHAMSSFATKSDAMYRTKAFYDSIEKGMSFDEAVRVARKSMFDYSNMNEAEKATAQAMLIFYTFARHNFVETMKAGLDPARAKRLVNILKFDRGAEAMFAAGNEGKPIDKSMFLPDYAQTRIILRNNGGDSKDFYETSPSIPAEEAIMLLGSILKGDLTKELGGQLHPTLKIALGLTDYREQKAVSPEHITAMSAMTDDPVQVAEWLSLVVGGKVIAIPESNEELGAVNGFVYPLNAVQAKRYSNLVNFWGGDVVPINGPAKEWIRIANPQGTTVKDASLLGRAGVFKTIKVTPREVQEKFDLKTRQAEIQAELKLLKQQQGIK